MSRADVLALLPLVVPAAGAVALLLVLAVRRSGPAVFAVTVLSLAGGIATLPLAAGLAPRRVTALVVVDGPGLFLVGIFLAATLAVAVLARDYLGRGEHARPEELFILLLLAVTGASTLALARHFVSFFLGLELMSVGLYGLIGYLREPRRSLEAATKYLVLAGASSAFFLFGVALVYLATGSMAFPGGVPPSASPWIVPGVALMVVAVGFKLGVAPFHMWAPDVYQGASAPVSAFIATVSKGAVVAVLIRLLTSLGEWPPALWTAVAVVAGASMLVGNVLALFQDDLKRILAYSSIAHLGYLLVALLAGGEAGPSAALFYLLTYMVTMLTAFGAVSALSTPGAEAGELSAWRGMWWRRPGVAGALTLALLSLAGIPVTGGFVAKFYLVGAGAAGELWALVLILVATSVLGLFYYLRVVATMISAAPEDAPGREPAAGRARQWRVAAVLAVLAMGLLWLGAWPEPVLRFLQDGVAELAPGP